MFKMNNVEKCLATRTTQINCANKVMTTCVWSLFPLIFAAISAAWNDPTLFNPIAWVIGGVSVTCCASSYLGEHFERKAKVLKDTLKLYNK